MRRFPWFLAAVALGCGSNLTQPDAAQPSTGVRLAEVSGRQFVALDGVTLFSGRDVAHGEELWRTDGTPAGTRLVKDIRPGPESSGPNDLVRLGDLAFFSAGTAEHGYELWRSDGTEAGTVLVRDINPGPQASNPHRGDSYPGEIVSMGSFVVFRACDEERGRELWRSDGTAAGTTLVADIFPGPGQSSSISSGVCLNLDLGPRDLAVVGGIAYFFEKHPDFGTELWRSDGTTLGTWMVTEVHPGPDPPPVQRSSGIQVANLVATGDRLFFFGPGGLWTSDGTEPGTQVIGPDGALLTAGTSRVFFRGFPDGLWVSDGTRAGTRMVSDVHLSSDIRFEGRISEAFAAGDVLFFEGRDSVSGFEPWRSNATNEGTVLLGDVNDGTANSDPTSFHAVGQQVYFMARTADSLTAQPTWRLFRASTTGGPAVAASTSMWGAPDGLGSVGTSTILVSAGALWAVPASR